MQHKHFSYTAFCVENIASFSRPVFRVTSTHSVIVFRYMLTGQVEFSPTAGGLRVFVAPFEAETYINISEDETVRVVFAPLAFDE